MDWDLAPRTADVVAAVLALASCIAAAVVAARIHERWSRVWLTLAGLIAVHIGRRAWEASHGQFDIFASSLWWTVFWLVFAIAVALQAKNVARFSNTADNLMRSRELSERMSKPNGKKVLKSAERIDKLAERAEQILKDEEAK